MDLTAVQPYKMTDSTRLLNQQTAGVLQKGIWEGGLLTPQAGMFVLLSDFKAKAYDGLMVESSGGPESFQIAAGFRQWLCLEAYHNSLAAPTLNLLLLTDAEKAGYNANTLIVIASFDPPLGTIQMTTALIDYSARDELTPVGRSRLRPPVADAAALAALTVASPVTLRAGDLVLQEDAGLWWVWDGAAFAPLGGYSLDPGVNDQINVELRRRLGRSGVIPNAFPDLIPAPMGGPSDGLGHLPVYPVTFATGVYAPGGSSTLLVGPIAAIVNGWYVQSYPQYITIGSEISAAGITERIDGLMIEVWREAIVDPAAETFSNGIGGSFTYATAQDRMIAAAADPSSLLFEERVPTGVTSDGVAYRLHWRIGVYEDLAAAHYDDYPFDGVPTPWGSTWDPYGPSFGGPREDTPFMYRAINVGALDGYAWALPLAILRRPATEVAGVEFGHPYNPTDGLPQILDVAPLHRTAEAARQVEQFGRSVSDLFNDRSEASEGGNPAWQALRRTPSGFIQGLEVPLSGNGLDHDLLVPAHEVSVLGQVIKVPAESVTLRSSAPASGSARTLVALVARFVKGTMVEYAAAAQATFGGYRLALTYEVFDTLATDADTAMSSAGFAAPTSDDPALWFGDASDLNYQQLMPSSTSVALAVALVHHRNSTAYDFATNPNGGSFLLRSDGLGFEVADCDVLDLRRQVLRTQAEVEQNLKRSFEALLKGRLRSKLTPHPHQSNVYGVQHTVADQWRSPGAANEAGFNPRSEFGAYINGMRAIWSGADQTHPTTWSFLGPIADLGSPVNLGCQNANGTWQIVLDTDGTGVGGPGTSNVTVTAPDGGVFVLEHDGDMQPYIRLHEISPDNSATIVARPANVVRAGTVINVTSFTFDLPSSARTSNGWIIIETAVVYKGYDDGHVQLVNRSLGTTRPVDRLISATLEHDAPSPVTHQLRTAPPMVTLDAQAGASSDRVVFDLSSVPYPVGTPKFVGADFHLVGTGDHRRFYDTASNERIRSSIYMDNTPVTFSEDGIDNDYIARHQNSFRVTCDDGMDTLQIVCGINDPVLPMQLRTPYRDGSHGWIEAERSGKTVIGPFVWGLKTYTIPATNALHIAAADLFCAPGVARTHQGALFWGGRAGIDVFVWLDTGAAGVDRWLLVPPAVSQTALLWASGAGAAPRGHMDLLFSNVLYDGYQIGSGNTIRVVARMLAPAERPFQGPPAGNIDNASLLKVQYESTPYAGLLADATPVTIQTRLTGTIAAAARDVVFTTAGMVPLLDDVDTSSVQSTPPFQKPFQIQHQRLRSRSEVNNTAACPEYSEQQPASYSGLIHFVPVADEFSANRQTTSTLPSQEAWRVRRMVNGGDLGGGLMAALPALSFTQETLYPGRSVALDDLTLDLLTPVPEYDGVEHGLLLGSAEWAIREWVYPSFESRMEVTSAVSRAGLAGQDIDTLSEYGKFGLAVTGSLMASSWRNNISGWEFAGSYPVHDGNTYGYTLSLYPYMIQSEDGNLYLAVSTRIAAGSWANERVPGTALDLFHPLNRPVVAWLVK